MDQSEVLKLAGATAVGVAQPVILKKMVLGANDTELIPQLGTYGKTSTVITLATSLGAIGASMYGFSRNAPRLLKNDENQQMLMAYGIGALVNEVMLTQFMNSTPATGVGQQLTGVVGTGMYAPQSVGSRPMAAAKRDLTGGKAGVF
jgi:hypothetical protein